MTDVTQILGKIEAGDPAAAKQLLPLVYEELKVLATAKMAAERPDHTLQATALVHEAYLRLVGSGAGQSWKNRGHFFGAAAEAMRRILLNHARDKATAKRGADWCRVTLNAITVPGGIDPGELIALNETFEQLAQHDPQAGEIAKLRIFAGLTVHEISEVLDIGRRTVDRHELVEDNKVFKWGDILPVASLMLVDHEKGDLFVRTGVDGIYNRNMSQFSGDFFNLGERNSMSAANVDTLTVSHDFPLSIQYPKRYF